MNMRQLLAEKRGDILALAQKHGASNVRVVGAVLQENGQPDVDLDLIVHLESHRSLLDYVALVQELEDLLGHSVRVATEEGLQEHSQEFLIDEAVPL